MLACLMLGLPAHADGTVLLVEGSTTNGSGLPGGEDRDETGVVIETPSSRWPVRTSHGRL